MTLNAHASKSLPWAVWSSVLSPVLGLAVVAVLVCSVAQAAEPKLVVTTDPGSDPESVAEAPDGSLILGSAAKPVIYRAAKGETQAKVFIDVSAAEGNVSFLGVLADGATNTLWACQIIGTGKNRHSILRSFDLASGAPKFRWPLPGDINLCNDFVIGPDKALYVSDTFGSKIFRLKPALRSPNC
ncbi:MAG: hypothetical protein ABSG88_19415 [Bradyrhizobium sp.]